MKRILLFDTEDGSKTLGGESHVQELFGCPPLKPDSWQSFRDTLASIYVDKKVEVEKKITPELVVKEVQSKTVLKNGTQMDGIIIDSFSELSKKFQRSLTGADDKMKLQQWGVLKAGLDKCLEFIMKIPGVVVATCHTKIQIMDDGSNEEIPYIDGSTKDDISKWFDFVFYTFTKKVKGKEQYMWRTRHSARYANAKDRTNLLDDEIPQDFQLVLNAAREKEFPNCKILVLGKAGTGKTKSLSTLINKEK